MADISFNQVPLDIFRPGIYMEIDPTLAKTGLPVFKQRTAMFGPLGTLAGAVQNKVYQVITKLEALALFGADSPLVAMVEKFRKVNPYQELLVIAQGENPAGQQASLQSTFEGTATESTTQPFYINAKRYTIGIDTGDTAADVAGNLVTVLNNDTTCPVTASNTGAVLTLTYKHKGEMGNEVIFRTAHYLGENGTAGLTMPEGNLSNGSGNPDLSPAIDALDDLTQYQGFVSPYTDTVNLNLLRSELDTRWGPLSALDGRVFHAHRSGIADIVTFAKGRNSQHEVCVDWCNDALSAPWEVSASFAANIMYFGTIDPARPFQTLELVDIVGAPEGKRRRTDENETLLRGGVSSLTVGVDGKVRIERAVTTYSQTANGAEDTAYKSLNTVMIMSYYRRSVINRFQIKFPRHKLATNGHPASGFAGNVVTPETAETEFLAHYQLMVEAGIMDDYDGYKADLLSNKNTQVRGRLDVFDQPRPIDQLHQLAVRSAFRLI